MRTDVGKDILRMGVVMYDAPAPPPRAYPAHSVFVRLGLVRAPFVSRKGLNVLVHLDGIYVYGPAGAEGDLV